MSIEPGLDLHDWDSEWQQLEPLVRDAPAEALPELHGLVERMLKERGILDADLVATEGSDLELIATYGAGKDVFDRLERGETVDPSDLGNVIQEYRGLFEYMTTERSAP
jgi:hypothetical protein